MPAKNLRRVAEGGSYIHVYNRGIENKVIFADGDDYQTFLNYLEDYLSAPKSPHSHKTSFTVKGKTYHGVPHQPKNYHNKIELLAYSLQPDHFHIIVHQKEGKSLQAFIRSLCTRYSMYYNKKYNRTGPLFEGPYKSTHIKDNKDLSRLTKYLHKDTDYSSHAHYSGQKPSPWVKTNVVLLDSEELSTDELNNNDYEFGKALHYITSADSKKPNLARRDLQEVIIVKPWARYPEIILAGVVLLILAGFSFRNMAIDGKSQPIPPKILGVTTTAPSPTPSPTPSNND